MGEFFLERDANLESRAAHTRPKNTQVPPPRALLLPPTKKMLPTLGARSFATAAAAPALWNKVSKVPADIRNVASLNSFKK